MKRNIIFTFDFTRMSGPLTRAGEFVYSDGSHFKDWDNLKDIIPRKDVYPLWGSKGLDSHKERPIIGFVYNLSFKEDTQQVFGIADLFDNIANLTDLANPEEIEFEVSMGFEDATPLEKIQNITEVDHFAMSLNNLQKGRCKSADGLPCYFKVKKDFQDIKIKPNGSSSQQTNGTRKIIKINKKVDTMGKKKNENEEKKQVEDTKDTEDAVAYPDNVPLTHKAAEVQASAKKAFMLDCQKYGPYDKSNCATAWKALNNVPGAPDKGKNTQDPTTNKNTGGEKDFMAVLEGINSRLDSNDVVMSKLAELLPVLGELKNKADMVKAEEMVSMKADLKAWDFCNDYIENLEDYSEVKRFYIGVKGSGHIKKLLKEDMENLSEYNTSRLLGKKKKDTTDFDDMMEKAQADAMRSLHPLKMLPSGNMYDPLTKKVTS
ncbi:hypothetical protein LCGC14_1483890, partial [marine sediment metagenome]